MFIIHHTYASIFLYICLGPGSERKNKQCQKAQHYCIQATNESSARICMDLTTLYRCAQQKRTNRKAGC
jgi:hypothetical protein